MRKDIKVIFNHFKQLYKNANISKEKKIKDLVIERRWIVENYGAIDGVIPEIDTTVAVEKVNVRGIPCEWIIASNADKNKRLLYLHGGAFIAGSLDSHRGLACELSKRAGVSVLNVGYKLAPENPFPAGLEDCHEAYDWLLENTPEGKSKAEKIFVAGDSAGGNLSLALLVLLKKLGQKMPDAVLPVSPVVDLAAKSPSINTLDGLDPIINKKALVQGLPLIYLFGKDVLKIEDSPINKAKMILKMLTKKRRMIKNPLASPLYADLSGLPPILLNVGDIEVLRDDSIRFADKARKQGVKATVKVWPEMMHVFIAFLGYLPEADQCLNEMAEFIKRYS